MTLLRRAGEVDGVFTAENLKGTPKRVCKDRGEEGGSLGHSVVRVRSDEEVQLERREGNQEYGEQGAGRMFFVEEEGVEQCLKPLMVKQDVA